MLFKTVGAHKIDPKRLITHRFKLEQILDAYETFGNAAKTKVLKVIIAAWVRLRRERRKETASAWGYKLRPSNSSDARAVASRSASTSFQGWQWVEPGENRGGSFID